jgi:hypothetical protein
VIEQLWLFNVAVSRVAVGSRSARPRRQVSPHSGDLALAGWSRIDSWLPSLQRTNRLATSKPPGDAP